MTKRKAIEKGARQRPKGDVANRAQNICHHTSQEAGAGELVRQLSIFVTEHISAQQRRINSPLLPCVASCAKGATRAKATKCRYVQAKLFSTARWAAQAAAHSKFTPPLPTRSKRRGKLLNKRPFERISEDLENINKRHGILVFEKS
jgi:hypothetical protein